MYGNYIEVKNNKTNENSLINELKEIKSNLKLNNYNNGEALEEAIFNLHESAWSTIKDFYIDDLRNISLLHSFLIEEIIKIHGNEESTLNNEVIKNNLNVKDIISEVEDGKLSSRIYFFNDEEAEHYFVGDIHSDDYILNSILERIDFFNKVVQNRKFKLIFLGDYVDRGKEHLKTMEKIMILKYIFPGNIFLLMGNHDGGNIKNDIVSLCVRKPEEDKSEDYFIYYLDELTKQNVRYDRNLIEKYLKLFQSMAVVSFTKCDGKIFCGVHGGIPRPLREEKAIYGYISSLSDLTDESKVNNRDETIINNILWSDPLGDREDKYNHTRRFGFTDDEFNHFADILGIDYLIRGHEANEEGYRIFCNGRLYCIFGSGQVLKEGKESNPSTAYPWVKPKILKVERNQGINIIDLHLK